MRRRLSLAPLAAFLVLLAGFPALAGSRAAAGPDLVIVHTNDVHAHYRSFPGRDGELRGGMARIAARIDALRAEHGDRVLYLDAGDLFQGTPFYHFYRGALAMELLDAMGCDAMALGNHELDDGSLSFFRAALGVEVPVLSANLDWPDGSPMLPPSIRLDAGGLEVLVVGLITEALPQLVPECGRGGLVVRPAAPALRAEAAAGADLVVALSHCGIGEDRAIAAAVPEVPLIVGGHSHTFLDEAERVGPVTITTTGSSGYRLGIVECFREGGGWRFETRYEPVTADWPEAPAVAALIEKAGLLVDREMNVIVAELPSPFAGRGKSREPDALGIFLADCLREAAGADLGMQNVGGYRSDLPAGPVPRGRLFELLPFDNKVLRLRFTGVQLHAFFDLLAAKHAGYTFSQIAGGSYRIEGGRAVDVRVGGKALDLAGSYTLATVDFLHGGGDGYPILAEGVVEETLDCFPREILEARLFSGDPPIPSDYPANFTLSD